MFKASPVAARRKAGGDGVKPALSPRAVRRGLSSPPHRFPMYDAGIDTIADATFGAIAARAARYPVIVKRSQLRIIRKEPAREPVPADPGIRWLLLNAQRVNRFLEETGWS